MKFLKQTDLFFLFLQILPRQIDLLSVNYTENFVGLIGLEGIFQTRNSIGRLSMCVCMNTNIYIYIYNSIATVCLRNTMTSPLLIIVYPCRLFRIKMFVFGLFSEYLSTATTPQFFDEETLIIPSFSATIRQHCHFIVTSKKEFFSIDYHRDLSFQRT